MLQDSPEGAWTFQERAYTITRGPRRGHYARFYGHAHTTRLESAVVMSLSEMHT